MTHNALFTLCIKAYKSGLLLFYQAIRGFVPAFHPKLKIPRKPNK